MSAPICLRSAFGACRPSRSIQLPTRSGLIKCRTYADKSEPKLKGVPKTSSKEEQKNVLDEVPQQSPPKRPSPQGIISKSPTATSTDITSSAATPPPAIVDDAAPQQPKAPLLLPANVIAAFRAPLKHTAQYRVPVASLQLRSFSVRSLEFFSDFALRAAYYLNLPASGPVPLPKRRERWTMPRSNFVNKKSQENFERITYKRLITIMDGEKSVVEVWLAVLRKWQFYGVGMKANVWEWEGSDVVAKMDAQTKEVEKELEAKLANFGWNKTVAGSTSVEDAVRKQGLAYPGASMTYLREGSRHSKNEV